METAWSFDEETMRSGLVQQQFDLLKFKNQDRVLIQSTSDEKAPSDKALFNSQAERHVSIQALGIPSGMSRRVS